MTRKKDTRWNDIHGGTAFIIPVTLLRHVNYRRLSPWAHKLVSDLACQFTGHNNGWLCASYTLMQNQGWRSENTLRKALAELEHYRIVERTQQGGRNRPTLLAFTFRRIDGKKDRFLEVSPTLKSSDAWLDVQPDFVFKAKKRRPKESLRAVA